MSGRQLALTIATALVAATALALGGCGGGDDEADAPSTASTAPQPATAPAAFDPERALIALSDLPTGWAVDQGELDPGADFCGLGSGIDSELRERGADVAHAVYATADWAKGDRLLDLTYAVGAFAPGGAAAAFTVFEDAMADCPPPESEGVTYDVAAVPFPVLGDESAAMLVTAETEHFGGRGYLVVIRAGDGLAVVGYGGLARGPGLGGPPPDVAEVERYARLATRKLREVQGGSP